MIERSQTLPPQGFSDPKTQLLVDAFLGRTARASRSLLMLDFDGTLAPFHVDRTKAFPYRGITPALQQILDTGKTRIVIISGRHADEVIPLLALDPHPEIWGLHGLQRMRGGRSQLSGLDDATLQGLTSAEDWLRHQHLQDIAEFKAGSIAVHWRGLRTSQADFIRRRVIPAWAGIANKHELELLEFDGGLEIRSRHGDKGDAVRTLLGEMDPNTPAVYLGDDITDEDAFAALKNGGGLSVLVRPEWRPTAAQVWLKPPAEVLDFLARWLAACAP